MGLGIGITVISLVFTLVITVVVVVFVLKMVKGSMGDKATLQNGVPASAVVMSLAPTGTVINNLYYVCNIGLRVQGPAQAPYDVIIKQSVPITAMARVNPGATIGVKVDPVDQTKVVIDWQAPISV